MRALVVAVLLVAGASAHAGIAVPPPPPPGLSPGDTYHRIFATSLSFFVVNSGPFPPNIPLFSSATDADWYATLSASNSGLLDSWNGKDIVYQALLSTSSEDAKDRVPVSGPVYNSNNDLIATGLRICGTGRLPIPLPTTNLAV